MCTSQLKQWRVGGCRGLVGEGNTLTRHVGDLARAEAAREGDEWSPLGQARQITLRSPPSVQYVVLTALKGNGNATLDLPTCM
jgi:hypothetical protein